MPALMDLLAGDRREMLLALEVDDWDGLDDRVRFPAHLALGSGLDPTWLDLFSEAVRRQRGGDDPVDFLDARLELPAGTGGTGGDRTVEAVDRGWIAAVALVEDAALDGLAGHWIDLLGEDVGPLSADEKPWIRELAGKLVRFARSAQDAPDVIFAWSI